MRGLPLEIILDGLGSERFLAALIKRPAAMRGFVQGH